MARPKKITLEPVAEKSAQAEPFIQPKNEANPLIITESQLFIMSLDERESFRIAGGTVTPDPLP